MAAMPNRMPLVPALASTVNFSSDRFTSGDSTGIPRLRQYWI